jgi:hypothetical protein
MPSSEKKPGWGLTVIDFRKKKNGTEEALILPAEHEAPFWTDLHKVAQYKGRFIYEPKSIETLQDENIC